MVRMMGIESNVGGRLKRIFAASILLLCPGFVPAQDTAAIDLRIDDRRLWLQSTGADLRIVLEKLAKEASFKLWISNGLEPLSIDVEFENLPLRVALQRLLHDVSHAVVYADDGVTIKSIFVLSRGEAPPAVIEVRPAIEQDFSSTLQKALQSEDIPDNIKAALLSQNAQISGRSEDQLRTQGLQYLARIIDQIEANGSTDTETVRKLREALERRQSQQIDE